MALGCDSVHGISHPPHGRPDSYFHFGLFPFFFPVSHPTTRFVEPHIICASFELLIIALACKQLTQELSASLIRIKVPLYPSRSCIIGHLLLHKRRWR
ncbi:hypothetical protein GOP47_0009361 [Adiantum capillus-veneris]|uniref:Uncharacterized protein n=1 Tax=Adiantum capillus-veneris TaxID=13818 RepID=A0A9D4UW25_ADICA|nr:hypothetical protein GOP47_0009361 [Adiantum capillus-veneris]